MKKGSNNLYYTAPTLGVPTLELCDHSLGGGCII